MFSPKFVRRTLIGSVLIALIATPALTASVSSAAGTNPITPGNFTGYGFDQCEAPSQRAMTAWRKSSPYRAVGIYISGSLRFCQAQTNLTPTWVSTQLAAGWHLLPIHLGAQASCTTRDRYQKKKINPDPTTNYAKARAQGRAEAREAVAAAKGLGIVAKSTLYYDIEAFSTKWASCRNSALWFLGAWTNTLHASGYVSGVYSSAASGIKVLDDARVTPGNKIALPDQIWIADWNGHADTNSTYIRSDGWPGQRIHQYRGGRTETWGGVRINVDRNYVDLRGSSTTPPAPTPPSSASSTSLNDAKCTRKTIDKSVYLYTTPKRRKWAHVAMQCLLKQQRLYTLRVTGGWNRATSRAVHAFQQRVHHKVRTGFTRSDWTAILSAGNSGRVLKPGSRGADVIMVQRALNAAAKPRLTVSGVYDYRTRVAVGAYQHRLGIPATRVVASQTWAALTAGRR